jgi:hypothetical protein
VYTPIRPAAHTKTAHHSRTSSVRQSVNAAQWYAAGPKIVLP